MTAEEKMLAALRRVLWGFAIAVVLVIAVAVFIASKALT